MNTSAWLADDTWWGSDKLSHLGWGTAVAEWLMVAGATPIRYWLGLLAAAIAVELVELSRYWRLWQPAMHAWMNSGGLESGIPAPEQPILCDKVSYKDMVWVLGGGVLAPPLLLVARWIGAAG